MGNRIFSLNDISGLGILSDAGMEIPKTEHLGNCIGNACGTHNIITIEPSDLTPDKPINLDRFLDIIHKKLPGTCKQHRGIPEYNKPICASCEREITCFVYYYIETDMIGIEIHCVGRSLPRNLGENLPLFESKLGTKGNKIQMIKNIRTHMYEYIIKLALSKVILTEDKKQINGKWVTFCCKK